MTKTADAKKIVIVGGGFGGIRTALNLAQRQLGTKIFLISDKPHFEYHAALYRVVTGRSPLEVCIPLAEIFKGKGVEVIEDTIVTVDLNKKLLKGAFDSDYSFDSLVLALGSETDFLDIPGLKENAFGFKSITEALKLKRHLHEIFQDYGVGVANILVVGGGASGVELVGELAVYTKQLAKNHDIDPSLTSIELVGAAPRVLPSLPEDVSKMVEKRLRELGVNVLSNRTIIKEDIEKVYLKDMQMKTKTVIWTAGITPNNLYRRVSGLEFDKKGRVVVDEYLQPQGFKDIYVIGDAASTSYSGMAQTALADASLVAENIGRSLAKKQLMKYQSHKPIYAIPVGPSWAAVMIGNIKFYGKVGWWLRRLADLKFFLSILPFNKALLAFQSGKTLCESCRICYPKV